MRSAFVGITAAFMALVVAAAVFAANPTKEKIARTPTGNAEAAALVLKKRDLPALRKWFAQWTPADYTTHCMDVARVSRICMTNSPFDDTERVVWERGFQRDERFTAALRIDPLLLSWETTAAPRLRDWGYDVTPNLSEKTVSEFRRYARG